jgi:hypothetical protein
MIASGDRAVSHSQGFIVKYGVMKEKPSKVILLLTRMNSFWAFACLFKYLPV